MSAPLRFPSTPILPEEDATERAMHAIVIACADFHDAIEATHSLNRLHQLRQRLTVCGEVLSRVETRALQVLDALTESE